MPAQVGDDAMALPPLVTTKRARPQKPNYKQIHRFPLPVAVHPLPPLIPHNPLSVISVLLSYLTYIVLPPKKEVYSAYFDSITSSVQVTDAKSIRALWEMGFFGKGSLSRSEPSWFEREKKRRGLSAQNTSEEATKKRRVERREMKLERARKEREAIAQQLKAEAAKGNLAAQHQLANGTSSSNDAKEEFINGSAYKDAASQIEVTSNDYTEEDIHEHKQQSPNGTKTVRFSPVVEQKVIPEFENSPDTHQSRPDQTRAVAHDTLIDEEHLQLSNEETFFLVYSLGAVQVFDQSTGSVIPTTSLLKLFARHSALPILPETDDLEPDNKFLVSYVVYHHFRSLGWVVRSGVKFGVDYLLYNRGPVFAHAEFAVIVLPSYEDPYWSATTERRDTTSKKQSRSWWWLHGVNRVQAQVKKTLVLCFVDIPPPSAASSIGNIREVLRQYKVREMIVRRWVPNRSRD